MGQILDGYGDLQRVYKKGNLSPVFKVVWDLVSLSIKYKRKKFLALSNALMWA